MLSKSQDSLARLVLTVTGVHEGVHERGGQICPGRVHLLRAPVSPARDAARLGEVALVDVLGGLKCRFRFVIFRRATKNYLSHEVKIKDEKTKKLKKNNIK